MLILTLNLEEKHPLNPKEKENPVNIEEKPNPSEPVKKKKPKDLNFIRDDETFSSPFIGHLKVLDTSTFNIEIDEYEEKEEEDELNKIVAHIKKLKFLGDDKMEEKEYERKFLV